MTNSILRSVRFAFVTLLLGLTLFTVAESALGRSAEGLSACGTQEQPCALDPVVAVVHPAAQPAAPVTLAANEGLDTCGSQEQPCLLPAVTAQAPSGTARLASAELPRMMMRVGS